MVNKIRIATNAAAPATGTYSQAIRTGDLVFVTGADRPGPRHRQAGGGPRGANPADAVEYRRDSERCRMLAGGYRQGYFAARGHQGFQSRGSDLRRLASRARRNPVAGSHGVRSGVASGRSAGHARSGGGVSRRPNMTSAFRSARLRGRSDPAANHEAIGSVPADWSASVDRAPIVGEQ